MKGLLCQFLRETWKPAVGAAALGLLLVGCGDDKSDPDAVDLTELKFAYGLKIQDEGNGTVTLSWKGMNNEDDFSGYNVYGAKTTLGSSLHEREGTTVKLLTDAGEQDADGKAVMQSMSYNGTDWEMAGTAAADSESDFSFTPYYVNKDADGKPFAPTCLPQGNGEECKVLEADGGTATLNGSTHLQLTGLKGDGVYCFTVLATLDEGAKVSQTTSEIRCVVPKYKVTGDIIVSRVDVDSDSVVDKNRQADVTALRESCEDGTCGTLDLSPNGDGDDLCTSASTKTVCFELLGVTTAARSVLTSTSTSGVQDLGYYASGFTDPTLNQVPTLKGVGDVQSKDGYSVVAQSLTLLADHVYVVAEPVEGSTTSFYYHQLHVKEITRDETASAEKLTLAVEWRLSNVADAR